MFKGYGPVPARKRTTSNVWGELHHHLTTIVYPCLLFCWLWWKQALLIWYIRSFWGVSHQYWICSIRYCFSKHLVVLWKNTVQQNEAHIHLIYTRFIIKCTVIIPNICISILIIMRNSQINLIIDIYRCIFWFCCCCFLQLYVLYLVLPCISLLYILSRYLIQFVDGDEINSWKGYLFSLGLLLANVATAFFQHNYMKYCYIVGMRSRTAVITSIYRKVDCTFQKGKVL